MTPKQPAPTKHTPGPIKFRLVSGFSSTDDHNVSTLTLDVSCAGPESHREVFDRIERSCAAAPELLAFVERVANGFSDDEPQMSECILAARALLAKVSG